MAAATAWAGSSKLTGAAHSKERARQYLRAAVARGLADAPLLAVRASRAWIGWLLDGTLGDAEASETLDEAVEAAELGWQATQRLVTTQVDRAFEAGARRQVVGFGAEAAFVFSERGLIAKAMTVAESTAAAIAGDVHQALEGELAQLEREGHGALAESYRTSARALLEATRSNESPTVTDDNEAASSSATLVMDDVIARIRALPGHKHFGRVTDPVALHQSIGAREDWLYIMASPWGTVALLIRSDGSHARSVIRELTRDQVEQSCEALSRLSGRTLSRQKRDSIARSAMLWLGDVLWDRLYSDLGLGSAALAVFPGGLFAVLPIEPARLMNPTRQARPAHAVRLFPSVALLKRSAQGRRTALDTALVVADPRLPGASADLRIVRTVFGQDSVETYIDGKADDTDLLGKMSNRSLIHFACHGEANLVDPEMSSITLGADRDLTVGELWHLELNATRLVVIGTCQSARTGGSLVDELVTFPTVFMRGGAGTVLATLWDIGDDATSKLLQVFYSELRQSATVADAVCASQLYFMESPAPSVGPGDWAALVCYG
jgi:hypothetical protein